MSPRRPRRRCNGTGCREYIFGSDPLCPKCEGKKKIRRARAEYQREKRTGRKSASRRGYGAAWRKRRAEFLRHELARLGVTFLSCEKCFGIARPPHVDHRIPRAKGGTDDFYNLWILCHRCHSRKTAVQDGRWKQKEA